MWTRNFEFNGVHLRVEEEWGIGIGAGPISLVGLRFVGGNGKRERGKVGAKPVSFNLYSFTATFVTEVPLSFPLEAGAGVCVGF
jgi:hypothetical protein